MGVRAAKITRPEITDPWIDPAYIAERFRVSRDTGERWIIKLAQKYLTFTDGRFRKRKKRILRIPLSLLEEHINELLN